jgi:DNA-binding transcriptional LysR family regulator
LRTGDGGPISIATVGTLASTSLTAVLRRFAKTFPTVELSLRTATSVEVSELVRRGDATIGLRYFDDPSPDLICLELRPGLLIVACAPEHWLAGKKVRSLRDLREENGWPFPTRRGGATNRRGMSLRSF